jgi:hypothetical protein
LRQQRFEHRLYPVRPPENALEDGPAPPLPDDGEIAGPRVAAPLAVDRERNTGREVRLADEQLAPAGELDYDLILRLGGNAES